MTDNDVRSAQTVDNQRLMRSGLAIQPRQTAHEQHEAKTQSPTMIQISIAIPNIPPPLQLQIFLTTKGTKAHEENHENLCVTSYPWWFVTKSKSRTIFSGSSWPRKTSPCDDLIRTPRLPHT